MTAITLVCLTNLPARKGNSVSLANAKPGGLPKIGFSIDESFNHASWLPRQKCVSEAKQQISVGTTVDTKVVRIIDNVLVEVG
jgi:hypothetical protein